MTDKKRFLLRLDQQIYDAVEKWASDEFRSVNAQIELLLKTALKESGRLKKERRQK
ncbi:Arc family DNA-binding protein [Neobacillus sp. SM06]|uniref:Arc family DNA-binding protein n=1 Tax=Neobacillus sp. SM06 TaxID=3422492 RepID=UPI003D2A2C80